MPHMRELGSIQAPLTNNIRASGVANYGMMPHVNENRKLYALRYGKEDTADVIKGWCRGEDLNLHGVAPTST